MRLDDVRLCASCCRSYDEARSKDATTANLIQWAAARAWRASQHGHVSYLTKEDIDEQRAALLAHDFDEPGKKP